jgi:hypothetical protein
MEATGTVGSSSYGTSMALRMLSQRQAYPHFVTLGVQPRFFYPEVA